jgi:hypothetical protein
MNMLAKPKTIEAAIEALEQSFFPVTRAKLKATSKAYWDQDKKEKLEKLRARLAHAQELEARKRI